MLQLPRSALPNPSERRTVLQRKHQPLPPPPAYMMEPSSPLPAGATATASLSSPNPRRLLPSQRRIHNMLVNYISTVRRGDFLPRLNGVLQSRADSSSAGGAVDGDGDGGDAPVGIRSYYANRPELRKYTLGVELDRDLDYTLILEDGRAVNDKHGIRSHFGVDEFGERLTPCPGEDDGSVSNEEILIRSANQSLLADALDALTASEEMLYRQPVIPPRDANGKYGLILPGPILSMTSIVEKCHFTVDLQRTRIEAICVLAICVPVGNRRLVLARAILIANFRPGKKTKKKQLQYAMQLVKAHHSPESRTLYDAAISLAEDEKKMLLQSEVESDIAKESTERSRSFLHFR